MSMFTLEQFFYRIGKVDRILKNLEKEIPELNYSSVYDSEADTELALPPEYLRQAEKTVDSFKWLFAFENDLREQIRETLQEKYPDGKWIEKVNLDDETRKEINRRIKNEQDSLSSSRINSDELDFCTLPEISSIITKNWDLFKDDYPRGSRFIDNILRDINRHRITVAHFSELSISDKQNLRDKLIRFYNPLSSV